MSAAMTVSALPDVETPDMVYAGDVLVVVGPEETPGIVGADFGMGALFTTMTAAEARALGAAFLRAADAAELVTA